ncbi:transposase [Herpetosiphon llansteffanensis]|uniref:transposase n=1 Tax=Herpetosiphon llansteffanensis TaxID=2094568 RepID=UPI000D7BBB4B|nr:transposase [Herpetosiphon llansteffanensis]
MDDMNHPTDRPTLTTAERQAILDEYDSYPRGDPRRGAILRQHGLYTSQLAKWRQRLRRGATTLDNQRPGPVPQPANPLADENARLRRENARLQHQLTKATAIIDIQKKMATLLGLASAAPMDNES